VADDGLTDDTFNVLTNYGGKIVYYYQPNGGEAVTRNLGLRHAKGEYIAFLDSDDVWHPQKLERQIGVLENNPNIGSVV
jgi:glycosyltransferase involved in cell wall biosynthesis